MIIALTRKTWEAGKENGKILSATIAPLSLMLALGNGQGGGDYYAHNHELVGPGQRIVLLWKLQM